MNASFVLGHSWGESFLNLIFVKVPCKYLAHVPISIYILFVAKVSHVFRRLLRIEGQLLSLQRTLSVRPHLYNEALFLKLFFNLSVWLLLWACRVQTSFTGRFLFESSSGLSGLGTKRVRFGFGGGFLFLRFGFRVREELELVSFVVGGFEASFRGRDRLFTPDDFHFSHWAIKSLTYLIFISDEVEVDHSSRLLALVALEEWFFHCPRLARSSTHKLRFVEVRRCFPFSSCFNSEFSVALRVESVPSVVMGR